MILQIEEVQRDRGNKKCSFWLIMAGVSTTFGGCLPVGYNIGVMNAPAEIIQKFCNESLNRRFDIILTQNELNILWSTIVSIFLIGGITGSLTGSWLADKIGRKGAYFVCSVLHILGGISFFLCETLDSVELLLFGRIFVGISAGLITSTIPMYLIELAPINVRGAMGVLCPLGLTIGVLTAQIVGLREILGTEQTWPHLLSLFTILTLTFGAVSPFLPESPKYLFAVKNQPQKALKELSKIRGVTCDNLTEEMNELRLELQRNTEHWNLAKVVRDPALLLPILLVCFMQGGQQLSGINAVFYYSVSIFQSTGLSEQQSQLANIGCGCVNLMMALIAIPLNSRCNRRFLFLLSAITAAFFLLILGLSIYLIKFFTWMSYISIASMLSYVFFYGLGLGPIPYFVGSELFEVGPRPGAMALGSMSSWTANFLVGMLFPSMQALIGPFSFGIFAVITIAVFFFIKRYFPETRGRNPSEVASLVKHGFLSRPLASPVHSNSSGHSPNRDIKPIN